MDPVCSPKITSLTTDLTTNRLSKSGLLNAFSCSQATCTLHNNMEKHVKRDRSAFHQLRNPGVNIPTFRTIQALRHWESAPLSTLNIRTIGVIRYHRLSVRAKRANLLLLVILSATIGVLDPSQAMTECCSSKGSQVSKKIWVGESRNSRPRKTNCRQGEWRLVDVPGMGALSMRSPEAAEIDRGHTEPPGSTGDAYPPCSGRHDGGAQVSPDGHARGALVMIEALNNNSTNWAPSAPDPRDLLREAIAITGPASEGTGWSNPGNVLRDVARAALWVLFHEQQALRRGFDAQQFIRRPSRSTGRRSTEATQSGPFCLVRG